MKRKNVVKKCVENLWAHVNLRVLQGIWITEILMKAITTNPCKYVNGIRQPKFIYHFYQIAFVVQHQCFNHMAMGYL